MAVTKLPLDCIMRCFYCVYFAKFALAFFQPSLAKEYTDFSNAGELSNAFEMFGYLFTGLMWTAATQFEDPKSQRKATQYGMITPLLKLIVLYVYGQDALGSDSTAFLVSVAENVVLFLGSFMTVYVWYKMKAPKKNTGKMAMTDCRAAVRLAYVEQTILAVLSFVAINNGDISKVVPNEAGLFGVVMAAASQAGLAVFLMGISQCEDEDQKKVVQYSMVKKVVELFYLQVLAAPIAIATDLNGAYLTFSWLIVSFVHMNICCYGNLMILRTSVFWTFATFSFFLGVLGIFYPSSTAGALYRVPELSGDAVFKLVGLGCMLQGTTFLAFSRNVFMDEYEYYFTMVFGPLTAYFYVMGSPLELGIFTDLLNLFLVWCLYDNFSWSYLKKIKIPLVSRLLKKNVAAVIEAVSPKASPKKMRGRSKTPMGRKSS